eukprot:m.91528 g.91528  ORF g.91528 m.91528 type:complete len:107 (+) comp15041_c0_seq1:811-1131(+)
MAQAIPAEDAVVDVVVARAVVVVVARVAAAVVVVARAAVVAVRLAASNRLTSRPTFPACKLRRLTDVLPPDVANGFFFKFRFAFDLPWMTTMTTTFLALVPMLFFV